MKRDESRLSKGRTTADPEPPDMGSEYSDPHVHGPFKVGDLIFSRHSGEWGIIMRVRSLGDIPSMIGAYFGTLYIANPGYKMLEPAYLRDPELIKDDSDDPAGYVPLQYNEKI